MSSHSTAEAFAIIVALIHVYIVILEMFLWTTPRGLKAFQMTLPRAQETKVLAANQGLYNLFLVAGITFGLVRSDIPMISFILVCVTVAGIYGAKTVSKKIFYIQSLPAMVSLLFYFISTNL